MIMAISKDTVSNIHGIEFKYQKIIDRIYNSNLLE